MGDQLDQIRAIQLISGDGEFNVSEALKLADGVSSFVVSIIGHQCTGKSGLSNHLFHTNFREMDTEGIWMARGAAPEHGTHGTLVLDLEGMDGRHEVSDALDEQTALFAIAMSDIVIVNMFWVDLGPEQDASMRCIHTVFQVMQKLRKSDKTSLLFVLRDYYEESLDFAKHTLMKDIEEIWAKVSKPQGLKVSDCFNIEIVALTSHENQEFTAQVASLRALVYQTTTASRLLGDRQAIVPASAFSFSAQEIWKSIKKNEFLDLGPLKVRVATACCDAIASQKLSYFRTSKDLIDLDKASKSSPVTKFVEKLSNAKGILERCLIEYDKEVLYFDDTVQRDKRQLLEQKLHQVVLLASLLMVERVQSYVLHDFKTALDEPSSEGFAVNASNLCECYRDIFDQETETIVKHVMCDLKEHRDKLWGDMIAHIRSVRGVMLSVFSAQTKEQLREGLPECVGELLKQGTDDTWSSIRKLLDAHIISIERHFHEALSGFEMDSSELIQMLEDLRTYARELVVTKTKEEAGIVLKHMNDRFMAVFTNVSGSMIRVWSSEQDILEFKNNARSASLKLLSVMAAVRLDDDYDIVDKTLQITLGGDESTTSAVALSSSEWDKVGPNVQLLSPAQCSSLWKQFDNFTRNIVSQELSLLPNRRDMIDHVLSRTLYNVKVAFDDAVNGGKGFAISASDLAEAMMCTFDKDPIIRLATHNISEDRLKLQLNIQEHITSVRAKKISELTAMYQGGLNITLSIPIERLLGEGNDETWRAITNVLDHEVHSAVSECSAALLLAGFEMDGRLPPESDQIFSCLETYARDLVKTLARAEARRVLTRMKDRFAKLFSHDSDGMPRDWSGYEYIPALRKKARFASLKLLSVMAVIRLDVDYDDIDKTIFSALGDDNTSTTSAMVLASKKWKNVKPPDLLIAPEECWSLWEQFNTETDEIVSRAIADQKKKASMHRIWLPPLGSLFILGLYGLMTHSSESSYPSVLVMFAVFVFGQAICRHLDVIAEGHRLIDHMMTFRRPETAVWERKNTRKYPPRSPPPPRDDQTLSSVGQSAVEVESLRPENVDSEEREAGLKAQVQEKKYIRKRAPTSITRKDEQTRFSFLKCRWIRG